VRLLWLDPIGTDVYREPTLRLLRSACRADTDIDFVSLPQGRPLDLEDPASEAIVVPDIVAIAGSASAAYDGILIGCFFDTALPAARAAAGDCVVMGPCEATTRAACEQPGRFSILVGRDSWTARVQRNVEAYGAAGRLASIRSAGVSVVELGQGAPATLAALAQAGRQAVERDGAEKVILGCTADIGSRENLEKKLKVPVLDSIVTPFVWLERQVRARQAVPG
jgi:allantoin racemase